MKPALAPLGFARFSLRARSHLSSHSLRSGDYRGGSRAFDQMQLERRRTSIIATDPEQSVYVTSPEDVILSKLEWYRLGGETSERQWRDILGVLKTRAGELDLEYLKKWAKDLKVTDLLERAFKESA